MKKALTPPKEKNKKKVAISRKPSMIVRKKKGKALPRQKKGQFRAILRVNEQDFVAHGKLPIDAFNKVVNQNLLPKTRAILRLEAPDGRWNERMLFVMAMRRFIHNPNTRIVIAKLMTVSLQ